MYVFTRLPDTTPVGATMYYKLFIWNRKSVSLRYFPLNNFEIKIYSLNTHLKHIIMHLLHISIHKFQKYNDW